MDFGFSPHDGDRFARHLTRHANMIEREAPQTVALGYGEMLDRIERMIDADPGLRDIFVKRFAHHLMAVEDAKVSLDPFPRDDVGTVMASIWDNQPYGKRAKVEGDTSRDKPARYALDIRACRKGHATPLTTKTPDFRANAGDLFTADQVRSRLKRAWKGMDEQEVKFLKEQILPIAEQGYLVARLCYKRPAKAGGGTHWHPYHYALINEQQLADRAVEGVLIVTADGPIMLPRCSTLDAKGNAFKMVSKEMKSGTKASVVIGQSRVTDLTTPGMKAWATGHVDIS